MQMGKYDRSFSYGAIYDFLQTNCLKKQDFAAMMSQKFSQGSPGSYNLEAQMVLKNMGLWERPVRGQVSRPSCGKWGGESRRDEMPEAWDGLPRPELLAII